MKKETAMRKTIFAVLLCALLLTACAAKQTASPEQQTASPVQPAEPFQKLRHAEISVKDYGDNDRVTCGRFEPKKK